MMLQNDHSIVSLSR